MAESVLSSEIENGRIEATEKFASQNYTAAADLLSSLLSKCSKDYGEKSYECVDLYLLYAKCLVEIYRCRADPIGAVPESFAHAVIKASQEDPEYDEEDDEDDDDEDQEGDSDDDDDDDSADAEEGEENGDEENADEGKSENEDVEEADPETNENKASETSVSSEIEVAWNCLELARVILSEKPSATDEDLYKLSDAHLYLGIIQTEQEQYESAYEDYEKALHVLSKLSKVNHRHNALIYYHHGLNFQVKEDFAKAEEHFKLAIKDLEDEKNVLNGVDSQSNTESEKRTKEILEIIEDLQQKIEDCIESSQQPSDTKDTIRQEISTLIGNLVSSSTTEDQVDADASETSEVVKKRKSLETGEASDINHLVRKKAKLDSRMTAIQPNGTESNGIHEQQKENVLDCQSSTSSEQNGHTSETQTIVKKQLEDVISHEAVGESNK